MMYKNILLGFDDSKFSEAALVETMHWAKAHDSKVTLVHAVFFDSEEFCISPSQLEKRFEDGRAACERAVGTYCRMFDVDIEFMVVQGEPHQVIPDAARKIDADLIVMGTYGRRGLRRMFMGSVTAGVILNAPCDVLVVKRKCEECTGEYSRILIPYDGSESSSKAIGHVHKLTNGNPANVTILYVVPDYEGMEYLRTNSIKKRIGEEATRIVLEGERLAEKKGIKASTLIENGRAADRITATAQGLGSDLIIVGSHGWHGFDKTILGSTTERVIMQSPVPVLVVK